MREARRWPILLSALLYPLALFVAYVVEWMPDYARVTWRWLLWFTLHVAGIVGFIVVAANGPGTAPFGSLVDAHHWQFAAYGFGALATFALLLLFHPALPPLKTDAG